MVGKPTRQLNLVDSAMTNRKKHSRTEKTLRRIDELIDWPVLVEEIEGLYKPSRRGRPSIPVLYMIKILFLQTLYNLSDPEMEDALIDRLSFQRFVGLSFSYEVPDFTTIWRFRERLVQADMLDRLFQKINQMLEKKGCQLKRGQMTTVDATLVSAAREKPKDGEPRSSQKDYDATATKKGKKGYFGYKGHVGMDVKTGLIHHAEFTPAHVHDSHKFYELLTGEEKAVFGEKAYTSADRKRAFRKKGVYFGVLDKAHRNRPLSGRQIRSNKRKSRIRNKVERIFAHMKKWYGYRQVRYLTYGRNRLQFLMLCMIYSVRRVLFLMAA